MEGETPKREENLTPEGIEGETPKREENLTPEGKELAPEQGFDYESGKAEIDGHYEQRMVKFRGVVLEVFGVVDHGRVTNDGMQAFNADLANAKTKREKQKYNPDIHQMFSPREQIAFALDKKRVEVEIEKNSAMDTLGRRKKAHQEKIIEEI